MTKKFLTDVYDAGGNDGDAEDVRAFYDAWAASYDAEIKDNGYATPGRCAAALAQFATDMSAPVLDFGCGTGLSGLALKLAGFSTIDGVDLSPDMLAVARDKKVYRHLRQIAAEENPIETPGSYGAIALIGVVGIGAAPVSVVDTMMAGLEPGGLLVLSLNDKVLGDPSYEGRLNEHVDCGAARLLFREFGDHLPGIDVKSIVYVLEKT